MFFGRRVVCRGFCIVCGIVFILLDSSHSAVDFFLVVRIFLKYYFPTARTSSIIEPRERKLLQGVWWVVVA